VNYLNKYKLHNEEQNKKEANIKVRSQATQFAKPPLQVKSENTDVYNCFDNIFSHQNKFSVNDLTRSNTLLAKKR
jgi:methenyltetrahydromethanopterin cyclohydrolase